MNRSEVLALPPGNMIRRALERDEDAERIRRKMTPAEWADAMASARGLVHFGRSTASGAAPGVDQKAPGAPELVHPRPGEATESRLYGQLLAAGYRDLALWTLTALDEVARVFVVQFAWGWYLDPRRGFTSDFAFPASRLLVEIDGGAHAAGRAKVARDVKRRGLAASAGWRLLSVTPAQVRDGEAVPLVAKSLGIA